jgi:predicted lysophospholipase L1 biosynthesis ABC-type transport system permease subunit
VARDIVSGLPRRDAALALYAPIQQHDVSRFAILARTTTRASVAGDLTQLVAAMDPDLPVLGAQTLESQQHGPIAGRLRIGATVAACVGFVGWLLAGLGVYGVTAYTVARRTREIGIRLSLGAPRIDIVRLVLQQGLWLVAFGLVLGMGLAAGGARLLAASRFGVPAPDALLLAGTAAVFAVIGAGACWVPARRAVRIRAMDALRYE